jgi:hypothetical protein
MIGDKKWYCGNEECTMCDYFTHSCRYYLDFQDVPRCPKYLSFVRKFINAIMELEILEK